MTDNIIPVDFGKDDREAAQRMARLVNMLEARDADMLARPGHYFNMASDEIVRLRRQIEDAREAGRSHLHVDTNEWREPRPPSHSMFDTLNVPKREWDALCKMREIIERKP